MAAGIETVDQFEAAVLAGCDAGSRFLVGAGHGLDAFAELVGTWSGALLRPRAT